MKPHSVESLHFRFITCCNKCKVGCHLQENGVAKKLFWSRQRSSVSTKLIDMLVGKSQFGKVLSDSVRFKRKKTQLTELATVRFLMTSFAWRHGLEQMEKNKGEQHSTLVSILTSRSSCPGFRSGLWKKHKHTKPNFESSSSPKKRDLTSAPAREAQNGARNLSFWPLDEFCMTVPLYKLKLVFVKN